MERIETENVPSIIYHLPNLVWSREHPYGLTQAAVLQADRMG